LFDYALYRSAADLLTTNGQNPPTGRASTLYGEAQEELFNQIEKYSRTQSFRPQRQVFFTHGTQQLRN
jgi:DNA-binding transcriptional MocR family regulator